ncbi:NAD(P)-binding protein [Artomyces pyxidatus]|uniref:NAD(P)-binding protein n=1 Tax=Artomyces pyxidatus TaxID=48021 RepID=A0ACB8SSU6_9AGAM|nr:NAD(P)-binding protein [Artomyces pyxidatus]
MSADLPPTIFFLGATGYLGSEFLALLAHEYPQLPVVALVRSPTPARVAALQAIHPAVRVVEGTLADDDVIQREAQVADIVINAASSDHWPSVRSTLSGLEKNSAASPGRKPLYIHVSGTGILGDNARGERVDYVREYSDIGLDLRNCPPTNTHLECDIPIVEAGTRTENPIRTIIVFPSQIYGIGQGMQKTTLWLRIFLDLAIQVGYSGTWGPGHNSMNNIHVKDVASALLHVLRAALQGTADEGTEGLYFASSLEPKVPYHDWTKIMGDYLFAKGIVKQGDTQPMPPRIVDPLGHYGWSLLGSNQFSKSDRLLRVGWAPVYSAKESLVESLPGMIEAALEDRSSAIVTPVP